MRQTYKPSNVEIGARIRAAREAAALTRERFAELTGISAQFAADLERGRTGASLETISRMLGTLPGPGDEARQIQAMLKEVDPKYRPYLIASLRSQIELIQALKQPD